MGPVWHLARPAMDRAVHLDRLNSTSVEFTDR
jgi:hypothetical protein